MKNIIIISLFVFSFVLQGWSFFGNNSQIIPADGWVSFARDKRMDNYLPPYPLPLKIPQNSKMEMAVQQLLLPDESWLCLRSRYGKTIDIRCQFMGENSVLIGRSDEGLVFSENFKFENRGKFLSEKFNISSREYPFYNNYSFQAIDLLLLRILYTYQLELKKNGDGKILNEFSATGLDELQRLLNTLEINEIIMSQAPEIRKKMLSIISNRINLGLRLENLRKRKIIKRRIINSSAKYSLNSTGIQLSELIFSPEDKLIISRYTAMKNDIMPLEAIVWVTNSRYGIVYFILSDGSIEFLKIDLEDPVSLIKKMFELIREVSMSGAVG